MNNLYKFLLIAVIATTACTVDEITPDMEPPTFTFTLFGENFQSTEDYDGCIYVMPDIGNGLQNFTFAFSDTSGIAYASVEFAGDFIIEEHSATPTMERIEYTTGGGAFQRDRLEFIDVTQEEIYVSGLATGKVLLLDNGSPSNYVIDVFVRDKQGNGKSIRINMQQNMGSLPLGLECF